MVSQPLPRWDPAAPSRTLSTLLSSRTPWSAQAPRSPWIRAREAQVRLQLLVDVGQAARDGPRAGRPRKRPAPRHVPAWGTGSWPTISTRTSASGCRNARRTFDGDGSTLLPRRHLPGQEGQHRPQLGLHPGQRRGPVGCHELVRGAARPSRQSPGRPPVRAARSKSGSGSVTVSILPHAVRARRRRWNGGVAAAQMTMLLFLRNMGDGTFDRIQRRRAQWPSRCRTISRSQSGGGRTQRRSRAAARLAAGRLPAAGTRR